MLHPQLRSFISQLQRYMEAKGDAPELQRQRDLLDQSNLTAHGEDILVDGRDLVEVAPLYKGLRRIHALGIRFPHLIGAVSTLDGVLRLEQYGWISAGEKDYRTYGMFAPTIRNTVAALALPHPRVLMLGSQTPQSAAEMEAILKPLHAELMIADYLEDALSLVRAAGIVAKTYQVDFTNPEQWHYVPPFDIAIGESILETMAKAGADSNGIKTLLEKSRGEFGGVLIEEKSALWFMPVEEALLETKHKMGQVDGYNGKLTLENLAKPYTPELTCLNLTYATISY